MKMKMPKLPGQVVNMLAPAMPEPMPAPVPSAVTPPPQVAAADPTLTTDLYTGDPHESDAGVPCQFITGPAGTGKTHHVRALVDDSPREYELCATTGIAAVNMGPGVTTINSLLKFFNYDSLKDRFMTGSLQRVLADLARSGTRWLVCDEVSMLSGPALDVIYDAIAACNQYRTVAHPLGLIATGDFLQLPPIPDRDNPATGKFAFEADCWPAFAANTLKLTKNWRQVDRAYLDALASARRGCGASCVDGLLKAGVEFRDVLDNQFDGTSLVSKNNQADWFNNTRLRELQGDSFLLNSWRWGTADAQRRPPREWKLVPYQLPLKIGAYVMVLVNDLPRFRYVNGSCGHITAFDQEKGTVHVELVSGGLVGETFPFHRICRPVERNVPPDEIAEELRSASGAEGRASVMATYGWDQRMGDPRPAEVHYDSQRQKWVHGALYYTPLRLAWASTVHKSQGLTLDNVQLDCRDHFFRSPAMAYVALSRCRTPGGLKVVGATDVLAKAVNVDARVLEWV